MFADSSSALWRPLFRLIWLSAWPLRAYWVRSDRQIGKRLLVDRLLKPLLPPPPRGFSATICGASVRLHYREDLGLAVLLGGGWERAELEQARQLAESGSTVIDVGANVGLYTAVLASAVGSRGRVLAFEPDPDNLDRLRGNVASSGFENVEIHPVALSERTGHELFHLAADPMNHSLSGEVGPRTLGEILIETRPLDAVWREAGSPHVSFIKIDTEGTEFDVLTGASDLIATRRPALLIEVRDSRVVPWLTERGYVARRPPRFAHGNVLFEFAAARRPQMNTSLQSPNVVPSGAESRRTGE